MSRNQLTKAGGFSVRFSSGYFQ